MKFILAPMEGLTGYVYRNAYNRHFGDIDKYITPFITPGEHKKYRSRELRDVRPENNEGMNVTVQMLTNNSAYFINTAYAMIDFGYTEVNLNLGCPSGTVANKGKGAGFLAYPDELDRFLYEIFDGLADSGLKISLKTRTGMNSSEGFEHLLDIYSKYPISELTVHPRIREDYYNGVPSFDNYEIAYNKFDKNILVYNGDIFSKKDYDSVLKRFPETQAVMLGRGIISNPALVHYLKTGEKLSNEKIKDFYYDMLEKYKEEIPGEKNVCFKLKENWFYMLKAFTNGDSYSKMLKKAWTIAEFNRIAEQLFKNEELIW